MSGDDDKPQEPWRESYQRHADGVRMVEDAANNDELYTQRYVENMREQFYKLGWYEGGAGSPAPPGPSPPRQTAGVEGFSVGPPNTKTTLAASGSPRAVHIRYMEVGEEGYIEPYAILEHAESQTFGVDVRFDYIKEPDDTHTVWFKRLSDDTFSGRGPDLCRLWRMKPSPDMPRVQYEKVAEANPE